MTPPPKTTLRRRWDSGLVPLAVGILSLAQLVCPSPGLLTWGQTPEPGFTLPEDKLPGDAPLPSEPSEESFFRDLAPQTAPEVTPDPIDARLQQNDGFYIEASAAQRPTGSLNSAQRNSDRFFDGIGGVPRPMLLDLRPATSMATFAFKVGPVKVRPRFGAGFSYNKVTGDNARTELQTNLLGAFTALLGEQENGRYLVLDYQAGYSIGHSSGQSSHFDQAITMEGELDFQKLRLGVSGTYSQLSGADREFSNGVDRQLLTISGHAYYQFTEKSSADFELSVPVQQYSAGISSVGTTATAYYNYGLSPKSTLGLGAAVGFLAVEGGPTQVFEQGLIRLVSSIRPEFFYTAIAGLDFRSAGGEKVSPIFSLSATWAPREGSSLSMSAERRVSNSASLVETNFTSTNVVLSYNQRLGDRFNLNPSVGYEFAEFRSVGNDSRDSSRDDQTFFVQLAASAYLFQHCTLSAVCSYRNTETIHSESFLQASTQITYQY